MIILPLYYFLYLFMAAMAIWLIISLAGLYHLFKYSAKDKKAPIVAAVYIIVSVALLVLFYSTSGSIDWLAELSLSMPTGNQQNIENFIE